MAIVRKRDFQRKKVYAWERKVIAPRTNRMITFDNAQQFVDGVCLSLGNTNSPVVTKMPKYVKRSWADCRTWDAYFVSEIRLPTDTPAWVILHEVAHALVEIEYPNTGHGPRWVWTYLQLLDKVLNIPLCLTTYSAQVNGVKYGLG